MFEKMSRLAIAFNFCISFGIFFGILTSCSHQEKVKNLATDSSAILTPQSFEWRSYNNDLTSQRFSPLADINTSNVAHLKQICNYDLGEKTMFESGPIVVDKILYVTTLTNTYALDASNCSLIWKHHSDKDPGKSGLGNNRGAAYADGKIFRGLNAGYIIALDAKTGKVLWQTKIINNTRGESLPAAPVVSQGLVYIGNAGGDNAGVRGRMMAFDINDGHKVWSFDLVPMKGPGSDTWPKSNTKFPRSGGATWVSYSVDEGQGLLYVPVGNAAPDFDIAARPGKNLYTNSVVILDAKTGALKKYYQLTPNDFHDWDISTAPVLIKTKGGKNLVIEAAKDGLMHAVDLDTDQIMFNTPFATRENTKTPLSKKPVRFCPGTTGAAVWNGPSYHPKFNALFMNGSDICNTLQLSPRGSKAVIGNPYTGAIDKEPFGKPDPSDKWKGWVTSIDADSGEVNWKYQAATPLPGAITATAGGLVFSGDLHGKLFALDAKNGKLLFENNLDTPIGGGIISYKVEGKQYIAVAAGLNSPHNWGALGKTGKVFIFGLL
ncbi:MAG: PQQ-binding-like beta-propeller repeat protein [Bacteriovorax sp.]|nr:PQQ-binding-like beta-propeller repeat protein [Bacteriovorax sp.]